MHLLIFAPHSTLTVHTGLRTKMYSIMRSVALLYIFILVTTISLAQNGYVVETVQNITCKDPSSVESQCSKFLDYSIPDYNLSVYLNLSQLSELKKIVNNTEFHSGSSGKRLCEEAGAKYLCEAAHPFRCEDEYFIKADVKKLLASCNTSRKNCSSLTKEELNSFFNCSSIARNSNLQKKFLRKLNCEDFPILNAHTYSCAANYKVDQNIPAFLVSILEFSLKRYICYT